MSELQQVLTTLLASKPETNSCGNTVYRFSFSASRYLVDCDEDSRSANWRQFDTAQDASYFGVWVNRVTLQVLTYAEGDWSLVVCPTTANYNDEIRCMLRFYGEGRICTAIDFDAKTSTEYRQDRSQFLIKSNTEEA